MAVRIYQVLNNGNILMLATPYLVVGAWPTLYGGRTGGRKRRGGVHLAGISWFLHFRELD